MPTSLMAEVILRDEVVPGDIVSLVFPSLQSVIRYESLFGIIPNDINWKTDEELLPQDRIFSFWQDTGDPQGYDWIHQFIDQERVPQPELRAVPNFRSMQSP